MTSTHKLHCAPTEAATQTDRLVSIPPSREPSIPSRSLLRGHPDQAVSPLKHALKGLQKHLNQWKEVEDKDDHNMVAFTQFHLGAVHTRLAERYSSHPSLSKMHFDEAKDNLDAGGNNFAPRYRRNWMLGAVSEAWERLRRVESSLQEPQVESGDQPEPDDDQEGPPEPDDDQEEPPEPDKDQKEPPHALEMLVEQPGGEEQRVSESHEKQSDPVGLAGSSTRASAEPRGDGSSRTRDFWTELTKDVPHVPSGRELGRNLLSVSGLDGTKSKMKKVWRRAKDITRETGILEGQNTEQDDE